MTHPVLLVPGIHGSGPAHWQSRWEALHPGVQRIDQRDWDRPVCGEWVAGIDGAVRAQAGPVLLVAHSLGCLALAHWLSVASPDRLARLAGVLMVAVPDPQGPAFPAEAIGFAPVPPRLPALPLAVWTSTDDPYSPDGFGARMAAAWGAAHCSFGARGHLNASSGLGDWPEGWAWVDKCRRGQKRIGGGLPAGGLGGSAGAAGAGEGSGAAGAGAAARGLSGIGAAAT